MAVDSQTPTRHQTRNQLGLPNSYEDLLEWFPWNHGYYLKFPRLGELSNSGSSNDYEWDGQEVLRPHIVSGIADMNRDFAASYFSRSSPGAILTETEKACACIRICLILGFINCGKPFSQLVSFIKAGVNDEMLPLSLNVISNILSDPSIIQKFWELQFRACPSPIMVDNHEHVEFRSKSQVPLQHVSNLGHGAFGSVDCVRNVINGALYARKVFHPLAQRKRVIVGFQKEMDVIRKLDKHLHVVTYVGSYVAGSELGILLLPIADYNLHDFLHGLDSGEQSAEGSKSILLNSFGCLTSGLAFMHDGGVRHKDIKPANILIHGTNVLFADFGLAFDFESLDTSATSGHPGAMTKKYSAREVHECLRRDTRSDVYSLGCVFLEISTVLAGLSLDDLEEALSGDSEGDSWWEEGIYAFNTRAVQAHLDRIEDTGWLTKPAEWCRSMMKDNSSERPRIQTFYDTLWCDLAIEDQTHQYFCHACLRSKEQTNSAVEIVQIKAEFINGALVSSFPQDPIYELSFTWSMFEQLVNVYLKTPNRAVEASQEQLLDLTSGAKIHRTDKMRGRALCLAAGLGDLDLVQRLLRAGVQSNFSDDLTPKDSKVEDSDGQETYESCVAGIKARIAVLTGASPAPPHNHAVRLYTPLVMAALSSHERLIEMLISRDARVNQIDEQNGATVLHYAASQSSKNTIELLLAAGGDIEMKDFDGETPLFYAIRGSLTVSSPILSTNFDAMNLLLDFYNTDINVQNNSGLTPLHIAACSRDMPLLRRLLNAGACPTITDQGGRNALHSSVYGYPIGSVNKMHYKSTNCISTQGICKPIIIELLKHGADINSQTTEHARTPLHIALHTGQKQVEGFLRSHGASTYITDIFGKTYVDYLLELGPEEDSRYIWEPSSLFIPGHSREPSPHSLPLVVHQMEFPERMDEPRYEGITYKHSMRYLERGDRMIDV